VFTALVPLSDDPEALLADLGIDPGCAIHSGKRAWQMPDLPDRTCAGLVSFTRAREIGALLRHPAIIPKLLAKGVVAIDPWLADNIGHVEGRSFEKLPASVPTLGRPLHAYPWLQCALLALPIVALAVLLVRPGLRKGSVALDATLLVAVTMVATLGVTLLGDGLADTAKQGHLVIDAALAWLFAGIIMCAPIRRASKAADAPPPPHEDTR
jgi:hypothetical protein